MTKLVGVSASERLGAHRFFRLTLWPSLYSGALFSDFTANVRSFYESVGNSGLVRVVSGFPGVPDQDAAIIDVTTMTGAENRTVGEAVAALSNEWGLELHQFELVDAADAVGALAARSRQRAQDEAGREAEEHDLGSAIADTAGAGWDAVKWLVYLVLIVAALGSLAYLATEARPLLRAARRRK